MKFLKTLAAFASAAVVVLKAALKVAEAAVAILTVILRGVEHFA